MTKITLFELRPLGSELFQDSENFLTDLSDMDSISINGGEGYGYEQLLQYGIKGFEFSILGFGINNVVSLAKSFSEGV
ncbi:hypothetical protein A4S05_28060 [Nostoc sp. KVJ20]|uniref:hypothetical protein n=1 Tax=Nostoc sp. KVJ20 TaxID=457944 RepID=UPI00083E1540|nr:hypothetical protein [Nostoc sp. KVJ20]ODH01630.1 hypothetical protein A4S05_28060 [Nostoc sp. KVJ20]